MEEIGEEEKSPQHMVDFMAEIKFRMKIQSMFNAQKHNSRFM